MKLLSKTLLAAAVLVTSLSTSVVQAAAADELGQDVILSSQVIESGLRVTVLFSEISNSFVVIEDHNCHLDAFGEVGTCTRRAFPQTPVTISKVAEEERYRRGLGLGAPMDKVKIELFDVSPSGESQTNHRYRLTRVTHAADGVSEYALLFVDAEDYVLRTYSLKDTPVMRRGGI